MTKHMNCTKKQKRHSLDLPSPKNETKHTLVSERKERKGNKHLSLTQQRQTSLFDS